MAVRLDKDLRATIDKVVASYNRKISYYKRQGFNVLPEKTSYQEIVSLGSRKAIQKELKLMGNLNRKNLDTMVYKGRLSTLYEKEAFESKVNHAKKLLRGRIKKLANIELKEYGKGAGFTMGDRFNILNVSEGVRKGRVRSDKLIANVRRYERVSSTSYGDYLEGTSNFKESFKNLLARIEAPFINKKLKDSYIESLTDLGHAYGYDKEKLAEMEKKIKSLSNEEFEKLFTEDVSVKRVFSYYAIMKMSVGANIMENQDEVIDLYDSLYDNLDEMIANIES